MVEAMIALVLVGLVVARVSIVISESRQAHFRESAHMALEDQASRVLDRVAFAVIGAEEESVLPSFSAPYWDSKIEFQISLGVEEDGEEILGDREEIGLQSGAQLYWGQNVGQVDERLVVWCNTVSEMLEDELLNGADDNDNGLEDELGLTFSKEGPRITIRLSLSRVDSKGERIEVTKETMVTCRN